MAALPSYRIGFMRAAQHHSTFLHDVLAPRCRAHDITVQQLVVLAELSADDAQTVTQLSDHAGILRTNFALTCKKMQAQGLIEKTPNPADSRSSLLILTEKGRQTVLAIDREIADIFDSVLADVPEDTICAIEESFRELDRLIGRLHEHAKIADGQRSANARGRHACSDS